MLELSCADYTFPLLDRTTALALIRLLRFDFVDIGLFERNPSFLPSALRTAPQSFIAHVQQDLSSAGLRATDVFLQAGVTPAQMSVNDPSERTRHCLRDLFLQTLDLCYALDCTHVTGLPGVLHDDAVRDRAVATEETAWRVENAAKAGLIYAIEPHVGSLCGDTATTRAYLAQVPDLTLTLDYGHFILQGEPNDAIHTLLPYASHLHLRGAAPGRLQCSIAESTIDLRHILRALSSGYHGRATLEYVWSEWQDCNRTDNLSETILLRRETEEMTAEFQ